MIRSTIIGYGNLGRSVEEVIADQPNTEPVGVLLCRDSLDTEAHVLPAADVEKHKDEVDMLFVCLGSATDIPEQAPDLAKDSTTVDIYDNHHEISEHRAAMEVAIREGNNIAMISTGWDPGLSSPNRVLGAAILPSADQMAFQGPGLSQGHSDAVRRVPGVKKGVWYTKSNPEAIKAVKKGEGVDLKGNECHLHYCFVVAGETGDADGGAKLKEQIRETIVTMSDYFVPYETIVDSISEEELDRNYQGMPHGGQIITRGQADAFGHVIEFGPSPDRNPDFTVAVQVAYGRAAYRPKQAGKSGACIAFEITPYLLSVGLLDDLVAQKL